MGVYVTRKCPNCKYTLERMARSYVAIGPPFVDCPRCGTMVLVDHIDEWQLKPVHSKIFFIFVHLYTCLFWAFGMTILPSFLYLLPSFEEKLESMPDRTFWTLMGIWALISIVVVSIFRTKGLFREIRESNDRMKDPEYFKRVNSIPTQHFY